MGQIPLNFCSPLAPKLLVGSEKSGMDMFSVHGDGRRKSLDFLSVCLSRMVLHLSIE